MKSIPGLAIISDNLDLIRLEVIMDNNDVNGNQLPIMTAF